MTSTMLVAALVVSALMAGTWLVSLPIRNASIVDVIWGLGFVLVAWATAFETGFAGPRTTLMLVLATIWGLRLSVYLAWRNTGKGEDYRYQAMRRKAGDRFALVSLGTVFGLQGALMWIISLPLQAVHHGEQSLGLFAWLGAAAWVVGIFFEAVGDWQLARFKSDPSNAGSVMDAGLWGYTRHPNYFGDFMVWWGLYLIAAGGGAWWTTISPLVMTALLMRYSGAGLLERSITTRRPGYGEYKERTNAFFPGPAQHRSGD